MALTQTDFQLPAATTTNAALTKAALDVESGEADWVEFRSTVLYYRPAANAQVMVNTRHGFYHWHRDCRMWLQHGLYTKPRSPRLMTRGQAEAHHYSPCSFCRELDERARPTENRGD